MATPSLQWQSYSWSSSPWLEQHPIGMWSNTNTDLSSSLLVQIKSFLQVLPTTSSFHPGCMTMKSWGDAWWSENWGRISCIHAQVFNCALSHGSIYVSWGSSHDCRAESCTRSGWILVRWFSEFVVTGFIHLPSGASGPVYPHTVSVHDWLPNRFCQIYTPA